MTTTLLRPETSAVTQALAEEIRAASARQGVSGRELARRMSVTQQKISRRIGMAADVEITLEEAVEMAEALGVDAERLVVTALRACRDSNPKPSDLERVVKRPLTADPRNRSAWGLAA